MRRIVLSGNINDVCTILNFLNKAINPINKKGVTIKEVYYALDNKTINCSKRA